MFPTYISNSCEETSGTPLEVCLLFITMCVWVSPFLWGGSPKRVLVCPSPSPYNIPTNYNYFINLLYIIVIAIMENYINKKHTTITIIFTTILVAINCISLNEPICNCRILAYLNQIRKNKLLFQIHATDN